MAKLGDGAQEDLTAYIATSSLCHINGADPHTVHVRTILRDMPLDPRTIEMLPALVVMEQSPEIAEEVSSQYRHYWVPLTIVAYIQPNERESIKAQLHRIETAVIYQMTSFDPDPAQEDSSKRIHRHGGYAEDTEYQGSDIIGLESEEIASILIRFRCHITNTRAQP